MLDTLKRPPVEVDAVMVVPVGVWVTLTEAPDNASPADERTVPAIELVVTCALMVKEAKKEMATKTKDLNRRISDSLRCKFIGYWYIKYQLVLTNN